MRIKKRVVLEIFAVALAGASLHMLAAGQAGSRRGPLPAVPLSAKAMPPGAGQVVGRVVRFAPKGFTQRPGELGEDFLRLDELIDQGEQIRTLLEGRAQIQLFGGPVLSLGPLSTLKIVAYDARTQQTRLELPGGVMRAESIKPTGQGSSFQVVTATAVVDGVGSLVVDDPPRFTRICEVQGSATVRNVNPSVRGEVTLRSGECTRVVRDRAPTAAGKAPHRIRTETRLTSVEGLPDPDKIFSRPNP